MERELEYTVIDFETEMLSDLLVDMAGADLEREMWRGRRRDRDRGKEMLQG